MKKQTALLTLTLLAGAIFLFSNCGEDEASIIGSWKVTGAVFNPAVDISGTSVTDAYSQFFPNPCQQDNLFIFESGNVFKEDEGATKCDPSDDQETIGSYSESGSTVTLMTPNDTTVFKNVSVTKSTFTGTVTFNYGGNTANVDFTLTRQ